MIGWWYLVLFDSYGTHYSPVYREPKFIHPFVSCKSAKIMLDPATGVSRGYGFVR